LAKQEGRKKRGGSLEQAVEAVLSVLSEGGNERRLNILFFFVVCMCFVARVVGAPPVTLAKLSRLRAERPKGQRLKGC